MGDWRFVGKLFKIELVLEFVPRKAPESENNKK